MAALDSGLPETAVEWLEQGRSIVWGELLELRSSYEELSSAHPGHARRLQELSAALEHAGATRENLLSTFSEYVGNGAHYARESPAEADRHRRLAIERDELLREIRSLPGFEQFLLGKTICQLRASAHSGPVVILNAAAHRCDALIVLANVDHVVHVPLPYFTLQRSAGLQNMLEKLLGHARATSCNDERKGDPATRGSVSWESLLYTLWKGIVHPVLEALAFSVCDVMYDLKLHSSRKTVSRNRFLKTHHAFFGVQLALLSSSLSMQLVFTTNGIRNLGTRYLTLLSRHTPLPSAFLRCHPNLLRRLVALFASLPFVSHPRMVYHDFQV